MVSIEVKKVRNLNVGDGLLAVAVFQKERYPKEAAPFLKELKKEQFEGKLGQAYFTSTLGKRNFKRLFVFGLGPEKECELDYFRRAAGAAVRHAVANRIPSLSIAAGESRRFRKDDIVQALAEGLALSSYQFTKLKSKKEDSFEIRKTSIISTTGPFQKGLRAGTILSSAQNYVRELDENPGNIMTPARIAEEAKKLAKKNRLGIKVFDEKQLKKMKMNGILAVGGGSVNRPMMVVLEYNKGKKHPLYAVVGKGITFDSGGISLKPSKKMEEMKYDKTGALVALGVIRAVSEFALPIRLVAVLPLAENLPSAAAQRPGDIIKIRNGKTVEVLNTDAEGRLVLADALAYVSEMKPSVMIDVATLTGAVIIALGKEAVGLFSDDTELAEALEHAGRHTHERVWRMPLWKEYSELMKGTFADIKNISETREAGSITAAAFLKEFVGEKIRWAHLDIAGVMNVERPHPYYGSGATGTGVRLITEALRRMSEKG